MKYEKTHGLSGTRTYLSWIDMRRRCSDDKRRSFKDYGGRGIKVCEAWANSFENFLADMGECPSGLTLERDDVNGDYTPQNCRWATVLEQGRNKRNNVNITINGETKVMAEWCRVYGIPKRVVSRRIRRFGWDAVRAVTTRILRAGAQRFTRGADSHYAKLTEQHVREIRTDTRVHQEIAADYGIHKGNVSAIKRRVSWAHLP